MASVSKFDEVKNLIWLTGMFTLSGHQNVYLCSPWLQRPHTASNAKQEEFCYIAKIEAYTASIRSTMFAYIIPDDIRLTGKNPSLHDLQPIGINDNLRVEVLFLPTFGVELLVNPTGYI